MLEKGQIVNIEITPWLMKQKKSLYSKYIQGKVEATTEKAILVHGSALVKETSNCMRCGRQITNPVSKHIGYGPTCSAKLGIDRPETLEEIGVPEATQLIVKKTEFKQWLPISQIRHVDITATEKPDVKVGLKYGRIMVKCPFGEKERAKSISGVKWYKHDKMWGYPKTIETMDDIYNIWPHAEVLDELFEWYSTEKKKRKDLAHVKEASDVTEWEVSTNEEIMDKLYPYQRVGVAFLAIAERAILADEMGLGKTVQALVARQIVDADRVLVICPNTLKTNWKKEVEKWCPGSLATVIRGTRDKRKKLIEDYNEGFLMINYALLRVTTNKKRKENMSEDLEQLLQQKFDLIIIDEAHNIRNRKTQWTRGTHKLAKQAPYLFALTGTPIHNRVQEIWSLLHVVNPERYSSFWNFVKKHANAHPGPFGWEMSDEATDPEALQREMAPYYFRRLKEDHLKEIPPKVTQKLWVTLEGKQREIYEEMRDDFIVETEQGIVAAPMVLSQITRLKQIAISPELIGGTGPSVKLEALKRKVQDIEGKIVVFSQFKSALKLAQQEVGCSSLLLSGDIKEEDREELLDKFRGDSDIKVLFATIAVAGVGLTLTEASTVIFLDKHWTPAVNNQAIDRVHRHGQTQIVNIVEILAEETIEEWIEILLDKKINISESIVENVRKYLEWGGDK